MKRALLALLVGCSGGAQKPPSASEPLPPNDPVTTTSSPGSIAPEGAERAKVRIVLPTARMWKDNVAALWERGMLVRWPAGHSPHTHTLAAHHISLPSGTYAAYDAGIAHLDACDDTACVVLTHSPDGAVDVVGATVGGKVASGVTLRLADAKFSPLDAADPNGAAIAPVWGDRNAGAHGLYLRLPAGSQPTWRIHKHDFHAVVLRGTVQHYQSGSSGTDLPVGTYIGQTGGYKATTNCVGSTECILYVFHTGPYDVKPG